jgi:hypothetical protein
VVTLARKNRILVIFMDSVNKTKEITANVTTSDWGQKTQSVTLKLLRIEDTLLAYSRTVERIGWGGGGGVEVVFLRTT